MMASESGSRRALTAYVALAALVLSGCGARGSTTTTTTAMPANAVVSAQAASAVAQTLRARNFGVVTEGPGSIPGSVYVRVNGVVATIWCLESMEQADARMREIDGIGVTRDSWLIAFDSRHESYEAALAEARKVANALDARLVVEGTTLENSVTAIRR